MKPKGSFQAGWVLVIVLTLSLFGWAGWDLLQSRNRELAGAERVAMTLATLIEGHVEATVQKIDLRLIEFAEHYEAAVVARAPRAEIDAALARNLELFPEALNFRVVDADGRHIYDASGTTPAAVLADRPYFQALKAGAGLHMVVSSPVRSRVTNDWIVVVARRLNDRKGNFAGAVFTAVRADFFARFYDTLGLGANDAIALWSRDLELFSGWPVKGDWRGRRLGSNPIQAPLAAGTGEGHLRAIDGMDGEPRLYAFRALRNHPFVVTVGLSERVLLAEWHRRLAISSVMGLILLAALTAVAWIWSDSYRRTANLAREMTEAFNDKTRESRALLDAIPDPAWLVDTEGRFLAVNEALCRLARKPMEDILGTTATALWPAEVAQRLLESQAEVYRNRRPTREERRFDIGNGLQPFEIVRAPVYNESGEPTGIAGVAWDISERFLAEERQRLITHVFDQSNDAIVIMGEDGRIITFNKAFSAITGYAREDAVGHLGTLIAAERHDTAFFEDIARSVAAQGAWHGEGWLRRKGGGDCPVWCNLSLIRDEQGQTVNMIAFFTDLSERKAAEARIESLANLDQMTLLPNQQGFTRELDTWLAAGGEGALLVLDLEQLGRINDAFGHRAGDDLLATICIRIRAMLDADDILGRLGGGQFAILLKRCAERQAVDATVARLLDVVAQPVTIQGSDIVAKVRGGICLIPADGNDSAALLRNAGAAMHSAKSLGHEHFRFFASDMSAGAAERLRFESDLRLALPRGELIIHYQPQVDIASGRIIGCESLLRWRHPELGLVPPDRFIPLAEESRLIVPIGAWVLEEACRQNRAWQDDGVEPMVVAVNLSAIQFQDDGIVDTVAGCLATAGLEGRWLELEITESVIMHDPERVVRVLQKLRDLGVRLSIDDFGTGYSSLSYLKRFPIDKIKIDKSFVRDLDHSSGDAAIVRMVIAIANELERKVIAEGVETDAQLDFLRRHNCVEYQGYLCSQAVPPEEFRRLIGRSD